MYSDFLIKLLHSYKVSYLMFFAAENKVFDYLLEPVTADKICIDMKFPSIDKMRILLNLFVGLDILNKEGEFYCLKDQYAELLCSKSKESVLHLYNLEKYLLQHHNSYDKFITALMRDAKDEFNEQSKESMEHTYGQAMQNGGLFASLQVSRIFRKINKKCPKILDIGGGMGNYSISIVRACPNAQIDIYERQEMKEICNENIKAKQMLDSISFHTIDITKEEILGKYDGILMSNLLHLYNRSMIIDMVKKVAKSLEDDGILVLHDFFLNEKHTEPLIPLLFTIDWMLLGANFTYSPGDIEMMVQPYGLRLIEIKSFKEIPTSILVLKKEVA